MSRDQKEGEARALKGQDLRTTIKHLSKGPMKFAFGYKDKQNPVLLLHKTKSAAVLRNELKAQHGAKTATHGTATADGKELVLDVEGTPVPGMKKLVKELLRKEKVGKYTDARVQGADEAAASADDGVDDGSEPANDALLEKLRRLQQVIQSKDGELGSALRDISTGNAGDTTVIADYGKLCVEFAQHVRGCGDDELIAYAKTCVTRAKKLSSFAKVASATDAQGAAPGGAPGGAPGQGSALDGVGIEGGYGDDSASIKHGEDGTTVTIKQEADLPLLARNFKVGPVPCYTKGGLKGSLEGSATFGKKGGGALTVTGAGSLELGIGATSGAWTAGPYGSIQLSANVSVSLTCGEEDGLDIQPFTFTIKGSGKVGVKVEINDGPKLDVEQQVADWELFIVQVAQYSKGKFQAIQVRAGKDMLRLIAALEAAGPKIEAAVEQYAPQVVKDAAVDAAEWAAESDTAGKIADEVQKKVDEVKKKTGVDVGAGVEELVQSLVDENGETAQEATDRVNEEMKTFDASTDDFHAVIDASGLKTELFKFRSAAEYNAIVDVWQAEAELVVKGKPAPGKWRGMVSELVGKARQRKAQQEAQVATEKRERQKAEDEEIRAYVAAMEGARTAAQGSGNVLNNRLTKTPNPEAKKHFDKGWQSWNQAEGIRREVASLQGPNKSRRASEARALYEQARGTWQTGLAQVPG